MDDALFAWIYIGISVLLSSIWIIYAVFAEVQEVLYSFKLREIQEYMKKVTLKPYFKNAYVECLLISERGMINVYIKERQEKRRLIILSATLGYILGDEDGEFRYLGNAMRDYVSRYNQVYRNHDDLIVADWAFIQRTFSPRTTFKEIHKMLRRRPYFTMYTGRQMPENPYAKPKIEPKVVEKVIEKVEPIQSSKPETKEIKVEVENILPDESYKNDERQVDL